MESSQSKLSQKRRLSCIRRNDADLVRPEVRVLLQQVLDDVAHELAFTKVVHGASAVCFEVLVVQEGDSAPGLEEDGVESLVTLTASNEAIAIELLVGEVDNVTSHSVLLLEHDLDIAPCERQFQSS